MRRRRLGELVFEQLQEEREQRLDGRALADQRREAHDVRRERRADVLRPVAAQLRHRRQNLADDELRREHAGEGGELDCRRGAYLRLGVLLGCSTPSLDRRISAGSRLDLGWRSAGAAGDRLELGWRLDLGAPAAA